MTRRRLRFISPFILHPDGLRFYRRRYPAGCSHQHGFLPHGERSRSLLGLCGVGLGLCLASRRARAGLSSSSRFLSQSTPQVAGFARGRRARVGRLAAATAARPDNRPGRPATANSIPIPRWAAERELLQLFHLAGAPATPRRWRPNCSLIRSDILGSRLRSSPPRSARSRRGHARSHRDAAPARLPKTPL